MDTVSLGSPQSGDILWGVFDSSQGVRLHPAVVLGQNADGRFVLLVGSSKGLAGGSGPSVIQVNPGEPGFEHLGLSKATCFRQVCFRTLAQMRAEGVSRRGVMKSSVHISRLAATMSLALKMRVIL